MLALATMNNPDLSIIIPALNEELGILPLIKTIKEVADQLRINYELVLVDDGSTDNTGAVMENLTKTDQLIKVTVIHNQKPLNVGYAFWQGVQKAQGKYVTMVAGDNEISRQALINLLGRIDQVDLITSYPTNIGIRPLSRRIISWMYVFILNIIFGLRLKYFNGSCLIRRDLLEQLPIWTSGFAFMSEIAIQLIKNGATYEEVPAPLQPRLGGKSKALSFKNFYLVAKTIGGLWWRVYFTKK